MDAKFQVTCTHIVGIPPQMFVLSACPRCLGTGYYNALSYGNDGKVVTVVGFSKLAQQLQKILTEAKRPSGYGFDYNVLDANITSSTLTAIKSEVIRCVLYLQSQQQQEKANGYVYLPTEEISSVISINVQVNPGDPRGVFVTVLLATVAGVAPDNVTTYLRR